MSASTAWWPARRGSRSGRRPALVARCTGVADVRAAVRFACERQLVVAVRGGGHNVGGTATCDGGIVIDLSPMKGLRVDPVTRTAQAQPGLLWGEVDRETQAFGLATPGGIVRPDSSGSKSNSGLKAFRSRATTAPGSSAQYPDRLRTVMPDRLSLTLILRNFPSCAMLLAS